MKNIHTIDSLRELNTKLLAEIAKLKKKNNKILVLKKKFAEVETKKVKLKQIIEKNTICDAKNAKLKAKIEKLESENVKFNNRIIKIKQRQLQNNNITKITNSLNNSSSNFNLITDQLLIVTYNKKMNTLLSEELISEEISMLAIKLSRANDAVLKMIIVLANSKLLKKNEMNKFLKAHKKSISDGIKKCNKKKKLSKAEQASLNQDQESDTECFTSEKIPEVSNLITKILAKAFC
ncbi:6184_t:CDS:1 [Cetraspora pellucida]|uniref:6184_t:CDS:1 n=1 Tax=Cetraspora pellucida TaxID=1433469 RepID=A0ACA9KKX8_9GLOM|nr:6184_t:CDS:1 [Cetraspora pellucida]